MPVFFGWLSCKILVRRLPKATNWFFNLIFCSHIHSPKRREIVPPHTIGRGQFSSQNLPLSPTLYFGWLSYVFSSIGGRPRPPIVFFHFPFPESNFHPKRRVIVLPKRSTAAESRKTDACTSNRVVVRKTIHILIKRQESALFHCSLLFREMRETGHCKYEQ